MALGFTQKYVDFQKEAAIFQASEQVKNAKNVLSSVKTQIEAIKAAVDANASSDADLITLADQANGFVNNAKYTEFITFVTNSLEG